MGRKNGGYADFAQERLRDLMEVYDNYVRTEPVIVMGRLFDDIVNRPARRFYVSEPRACAVVSKIQRGESLSNMRPLKIEMFQEIHRRVAAVMILNPSVSLASAVREVIYEPAPKFYITSSSAKSYLYPVRRVWYETKMRKVQFWALPW